MTKYVVEVDPTLLDKAVEVYDLERQLDPLNTENVRTAITAVLAQYEQQVLQRVIRGARALAENIRVDVDPSDEGAAALEIFAVELEDEVPKLNSQYDPENGDLIELSLVGEVTVYEDGCANCGEERVTLWSIRDLYTGLEVYFEPQEMGRAHVRVISKGEPYFAREDATV